MASLDMQLGILRVVSLSRGDHVPVQMGAVITAEGRDCCFRDASGNVCAPSSLSVHLYTNNRQIDNDSILYILVTFINLAPGSLF